MVLISQLTKNLKKTATANGQGNFNSVHDTFCKR